MNHGTDKPSHKPSQLIEYGMAMLPLPGEVESGDRHVVRHFHNGVLVGVVDGLGHGTAAAEAAKMAVTTLEAHAQESIISLVRRCQQELKGTRGVVMSLASFNGQDNTLTWLGVGNVAGVLMRAEPQANPASPAREELLQRAGVVGLQLPALYATVFPVVPGDILVFATDGIRRDFYEAINLREAPQRIADQICARYSTHTDDALVLVVRYLGCVP